MSKNTDEKVADLFDEFVEDLLDCVKSAETTAADRRVIREFLKDNNIQAGADAREKMGKLHAFPYPTESDVVAEEQG